MAQVFISYSKAEAGYTVELARDLESSGISVWWDTSLLPDDPHFPETIRREIGKSSAAIVIWTASSVQSRWVYAEAKSADAQDKLIQLRVASLSANDVPLPFNSGHIGLVTERDALYGALARKGITTKVVRDRGAGDTNPHVSIPSINTRDHANSTPSPTQAEPKRKESSDPRERIAAAIAESRGQPRANIDIHWMLIGAVAKEMKQSDNPVLHHCGQALDTAYESKLFTEKVLTEMTIYIDVSEGMIDRARYLEEHARNARNNVAELKRIIQGGLKQLSLA